MKIQPITSSTNAVLKKIKGLHHRNLREKQALFLVEGPKCVEEAFQHGVAITDVVVSQTYLQESSAAVQSKLTAVSVVEDKLFKELTTTSTPAGIIAVAKMLPQAGEKVLSRGNPLVLVAHGIQDPGNLGTMIRTALAASATAIVLTKGTVDPYNPKVVRSAMGALFALPMFWDLSFCDAVSLLKRHSLRVVACDAKSSLSYFQSDLSKPTAVIVGNEGHGFDQNDLKQVDEIVSIPMDEKSESLNAAISAAIVLFQAVQQRS